ncbi:MAG: ATP-binding protein [Chthoniobacteraceae bacterium]
MKSILILTRQPSFAAAIQSAVSAAAYQIIAKEDVWEAESLLGRGAIDITILDVELTDVRATKLIEELRLLAPSCPMLIYTAAKSWEWEEDAYLLGVSHVMMKPVRGRLLNALLERVLNVADPRGESPEPLPAIPEPRYTYRQENGKTLEGLRDFSEILTHNLDPSSLLRQFLLRLREILGVNRAVVFLRKPSEVVADAVPTHEDRWLRSECAIGIEQMFLDHFALSLTAGIGGTMRRQGRILKAGGPEVQGNRDIAREFSLLGVNVAIPILDRQSLIGVAVFDERLTGEPFSNEELSLVFHMLEELGVAIRNCWQHDLLEESHEMMGDILGQLHSGCLVFGTNLSVLHCNAAARRMFLPDGGRRQLEFSDLPQELGSKVFTVTKTGQSFEPFKYVPAHSTMAFEVTIKPFRMNRGEESNAAMLVIEDITEAEHAKNLEIEASNLRLIKSMAEHLAHEIGNSAVPLSTHQQLLVEKFDDPEFRDSLSKALEDGVKRISRLANQMVFLARDKHEGGERISVSDLIGDAFRDAYQYYAGETPKQFDIEREKVNWTIKGDRKALRHAFSEVILNALQANPKDPKVAVKMEKEPENGGDVINVEVRDTGAGFSPEAAEKAPDPFFSTRTVGLGLGLTVSTKIIENHNGKIEIPASKKGEPGMVRIQLPLNETIAEQQN